MFLHPSTSPFSQHLMSITGTMDAGSQSGTPSTVPATGTANVDIVKKGNQCDTFGRRGHIGLNSPDPMDGPPVPEYGWTSSPLTPPPVVGDAELGYRDSQPSSLSGSLSSFMTAVSALPSPPTLFSCSPAGSELVAVVETEIEPEPQPEPQQKPEPEPEPESEPEIAAQTVAKTPPAVASTAKTPVASRSLPVLFPKRKNMLIFDRSPNDSLKQEFDDILDRLEEPLLKHVYKPKEQHQPILIRFGYLGVSEPEAQPSIVVFCSEKKGKKVWKFFKERAKELCEPSNDGFPTLAVYVVGFPPCPRLWEVSADVRIAVTSQTPCGQTEETYCGAPIRLVSEISSIQVCATLGGMIKTRASDSKAKLWSMTAGHVLDTWRDLGQNFEPESESDSDSDSELSDPGDAEDVPTSELVSWSPGQYHQVATSIKTPVSEADSSFCGRYYDWAIFEVDKAKRNVLPGRPQDAELSRDLIMPLEETIFRPDTPRSVAMLSPSNPMSPGLLTDGPSRLLLRPGKSLVRTLILTLGEGSRIANGDSGSWVVDPSSLEVFGHVVASDILGDVYVVPIRDTFNDIKQSLGASEVTLPTVDDIRHAEMQQNPNATNYLAERPELRKTGPLTTATVSSISGQLRAEEKSPLLLDITGDNKLYNASETTNKLNNETSRKVQILKDENMYDQDRIRMLEKKLPKNEIPAIKPWLWGIADTADDTAVETNVFLTDRNTIPQVRECNFAEFDNRFNRREGRYAVDVLVSGTLLHQEMTEEHNLRAKLLIGQRDTHGKSSPLAMKTAVKTAAVAMDLIQQAQSKNVWPRRIRIQSPALLRILARVHRERWPNIPRTYCRPFSALIYRHERVREILRELEEEWGYDLDTSGDPDISDHKSCPESDDDESSEVEESARSLASLRSYVKYIEEKIMPEYRRFETLEDAKTAIRFSDLWYLFRTGELVYRPNEGEHLDEFDQPVWRTYRITPAPEKLVPTGDGVEMDEDSAADSPFTLMCYHIDYTGSEFCVVTKTFEIWPFRGELSINDLSVYPIRFRQDSKRYLDNTVETGNSVLAIIKAKHCVYRGWAVIPAGVRQLEAKHINGEVMVDFTEAFQSLPALRPRKTVLRRLPRQGQAVDTGVIYWWSDNRRSRLLEEAMTLLSLESVDTAKEQSNMFISQDPFLVAVVENEKRGCLTTEMDIPGESKVLLTHRVFGYVFQQHAFMQLSAPQMRPAEPKSPGALEALQIPQSIKKAILSTTQGHLIRKEVERRTRASGLSSDEFSLDLAPVKSGLGLFILLHGPPGVGKTFTTEAMARALGKPLFHIHIGRLTVNPEYLDASLRRIFRLAASWDCILVLDEADLLFARSAIAGQNLLSIFFQRLDCYDGILFLTATHGDANGGWESLTSRMHYVIHYPPLTLEQTLNIWRLNIQRVRKIDEAVSAAEGRPLIQIHEEGLLAFAEEHFWRNSHRPWNGRQIKNAFQAAHTFAYDRYREQQQQLKRGTSPTEPTNPPRLDLRHFETIDYEWYLDDNPYDPGYDASVYGSNSRTMTDSGYVGSSVSGSFYRGNMGDSGYAASTSASSYYRENLRQNFTSHLMGILHEDPSAARSPSPRAELISAPVPRVSELRREHHYRRGSRSVTDRAEAWDDRPDTPVPTTNITSTSSDRG